MVPDRAAVTKGLIDCTPPLAEACAIQRLVIASAYRHEFGLLRNWPDASLRLRARWLAKTRRRSNAANDRRNFMPHLTKKQRQEQFWQAFLRRIRETPPRERV